ncbi:MAG TPA: hypothetical protein VKA01_08510, partial [Vicinamibacteria bacterium]|nr:hypothetical protein [Vicinamibacteria bacterium]
ALVLGLGVAACYYAHYVGLIVAQVPRMMEGGGQGRGTAIGFGGALWQQASTVLRELGIPVLVLLLFARFKGGLELERDLRAFACGAAALALPAVISPLEVRYVLALGPAVAWFAAEGAWRLLGDGWMGRLAASGLLLSQAVLGVHNLVHALLFRYR